MSDAKESQYLAVIRVWAAMAWADGVIADSEAQAIRKLISVAELTDAEKAAALGFLEQRVELETESMRSLSEAARIGIYQAALRLALVDSDFDSHEEDLLRRLRDGLGISAAKAEELQKGM